MSVGSHMMRVPPSTFSPVALASGAEAEGEASGVPEAEGEPEGSLAGWVQPARAVPSRPRVRVRVRSRFFQFIVYSLPS